MFFVDLVSKMQKMSVVIIIAVLAHCVAAPERWVPGLQEWSSKVKEKPELDLSRMVGMPPSSFPVLLRGYFPILEIPSDSLLLH